MVTYRRCMERVRPLREVLDDLAGAGPGAAPRHALDQAGHGELPAGLVAEAVASYADTAPIEVAEHLAPFVTAHRTSGEAEPGAALDLLVSAPLPPPEQRADASSLLEAEVETAEPDPPAEVSAAEPSGLDFGTGDRDEPELGVEAAEDPGSQPPVPALPSDSDPSFPMPVEGDPSGHLWPAAPLDETDIDGSALDGLDPGPV